MSIGPVCLKRRRYTDIPVYPDRICSPYAFRDNQNGTTYPNKANPSHHFLPFDLLIYSASDMFHSNTCAGSSRAQTVCICSILPKAGFRDLQVKNPKVMQSPRPTTESFDECKSVVFKDGARLLEVVHPFLPLLVDLSELAIEAAHPISPPPASRTSRFSAAPKWHAASAAPSAGARRAAWQPDRGVRIVAESEFAGRLYDSLRTA